MAIETEVQLSGPATRSGRAKLIVSLGVLGFVAVALVVTWLKGDHQVPLDKELGLPLKPGVPYITANHIGATVGMTLFGLVGVAMGIRHYFRERTVLPLMVAVSGALICIPEVFFDVMGAVYFPWSDTEPLGHVYTIIGREMPAWIIAGWFGYGAFNYFTFTLLTRNPTTKKLWIMLVTAAAASGIFEEILLKFDVYHYYGHHPLILFWEFPWWWLACNPVGVFLAAALAYRFRHYLQGVRALWMLVITPMSVSTAYGAAALPGWIAVNANLPWLLTQVLGLMSLALGFLFSTLILRLVLNRDPFDLDYAPPAEQEAPAAQPAQH